MSDEKTLPSGSEMPRPLARALARALSDDLVEAIQRAISNPSATSGDPYTVSVQVASRIEKAQKARPRDEEK